jgi:hypothetical protein
VAGGFACHLDFGHFTGKFFRKRHRISELAVGQGGADDRGSSSAGFLPGQPRANDMFYRRRLPHWIPEDAIIFLTWRLAGSTPVPLPELITLDYLAGKRESSIAASGPFGCAIHK